MRFINAVILSYSNENIKVEKKTGCTNCTDIINENKYNTD